MADRIIGALYIFVGIGIAVTLIFGDGAPLSMDWMLTWIGLVVAAVWFKAPFLVVPALIYFGFRWGHAEKEREIGEVEQRRRVFGELWKRVLDKDSK